ncbi:MAG: hypothetical protein RJA81_443 [Planctomycetota bacterium]|jgi:hypothetical protein
MRIFLKTLLIIAAANFLRGNDLKADLYVGAAVKQINPAKPLPASGGLGIPNATKERKGDLTTRAIVLKNGETVIAIAAIDTLGFPGVLVDRVRKMVPQIPAENIMIGATHTHSAPDCYAFPDGKGGHTADLQYIDMVIQQTAEAIHSALAAIKPSVLRINTGEAKGQIAFNYYAPDLYDRRMSVIQALDKSTAKPLATLVNYAIHPEVLGAGQGILSPDLIGPLCERLEKETGAMALFMNGAQGGMITADNRDLNKVRDPLRGYWEGKGTWEECQRIGHLMAAEAMRIIGQAPVQSNPTLYCKSKQVRFPVDSPELWSVITLSPLKYPHHAADRSIDAQVNLVNLGNAQILTIPGEALPNIGFYLKRKMKGENNLLFGLTNEAFGYILTKVDFRSFPRYDYVSRTSLGEMTGEILIEKSLEMVESAPVPERVEK